jgi:hypothetical protein
MVSIKKNTKKYNEYNVIMKVTAGKILAIKDALQAANSAVGNDVLQELEAAYQACKESET